MNSNFEPDYVNASNDINLIVKKIFERYEEKKASKQVAALLQNIARGGSYHDVYVYARSIGLGDIFKDTINSKDFVMNMENYDEIARGFMSVVRKYSEDINDLAELAQKGINEGLGINIKAQRVRPKNEQLTTIVEGIIKGIDDANNELLKFSAELTDQIIKANAELQTKSGFDVVVVRRYDDVGIHNYSNYADVSHRKTLRGARECPFCKAREGTYNYEDTKKNNAVWQRHKGCTCSIDFVNNGLTERVNNYV